MTQILAAITHEYVLLASDRRLTIAIGPRKGEVISDDTCKLVCLCGKWGIAYTGWSELHDPRSSTPIPTHEWIALRLAERACRDASLAAAILADEAAKAMDLAIEPLTCEFVIAGWVQTGQEPLRPQLLHISNVHDAEGNSFSSPQKRFSVVERRLAATERYASCILGASMHPEDEKDIDKFLRTALKHGASPNAAMKKFAHQIARTSASKSTVGTKVLAFCIPKAAASRAYSTGGGMLAATEPTSDMASFCYFDPLYSELKQFGPTVTCGETAFTDTETTNDPDRKFQSSKVRYLHVRKQTGVMQRAIRIALGKSK